MAVPIYENYNGTTNFSDVAPRFAINAGNEVTYTVPGSATNKLQVLFSFNDDTTVYVGYNVTAAVPAANSVSAGRFIELLPEKRFVKGGDVLSFVTPDPIAYVGLSFRALQ
jgi:hypothetical protein